MRHADNGNAISRICLAVCAGVFAATAAGGAAAFDVPRLPWNPAAYTCPRLAAAPVLDGRPDDPAWAPAPWSAPFGDIQGPLAFPPRHVTKVRLGWDADCLYIGAWLDEPHVWATLRERDAVIYHDNDFEVFIDPDGDNHLYGELEINALGTVWDLLLARPYRDGGPAIDAWDIAGLRTAVAVDGTLNDPRDTDRGWGVEIAIPWRVLAPIAGRACPPAAGDVWRLNFSRVQWRTEIVDGAYRKISDPATGRSLPEDNWTWSPQGLIAMHCPEMWGEVVFDDRVGQDGSGRDGAGRDVATSAGHARIALANLLLPVYYRQQAYREANGSYAADAAALGIPAGARPGWPGDADGGKGCLPLPPDWLLLVSGGRDWFRAELATPRGKAAIDHTGRLEGAR